MADQVRSLSLALIGVGQATEHQIAALSFGSRWTIAGAADVNPERRSVLPSGVPFFGSTEQLLENIEADLFLVAVPTQDHFDQGMKVLSAGRNLLIEKPCCRSELELNALLRAAGDNGAFFSVALHAMYARDLRWFLDHRADLALGEPTAIRAGFFDPYVLENGRLAPAALSLGGSWFDSGINALSVLGTVVAPAEFEAG